jgi:hypothetical protein
MIIFIILFFLLITLLLIFLENTKTGRRLSNKIYEEVIRK